MENEALQFLPITDYLKERRLYPVVYVAFDMNTLEVILKTVITDRQLREMELSKNIGEFVKILSKVFIDGEWVHERDAALRIWEIYGTFSIIKKVSNNDRMV